ncbi:MAG: tRNA (adenosine(37)-N6)-threonylcarbamoyltransferase complex ATPase subunit type 1 TsaE [Pseudomonadales bacterium]
MKGQFFAVDETQMQVFGNWVYQALSTGVIFLVGDLGVGKTTLSKGVVRASGYEGAIKSPTYTLVEPYELDGRTVYHFDLYRLTDPEELEYMGIRDYFDASTLSLIEWPQRGEGFLPQADLTVEIAYHSDGRTLAFSAGTEKGRAAADTLQSLIKSAVA